MPNSNIANAFASTHLYIKICGVDSLLDEDSTPQKFTDVDGYSVINPEADTLIAGF